MEIDRILWTKGGYTTIEVVDGKIVTTDVDAPPGSGVRRVERTIDEAIGLTVEHDSFARATRRAVIALHNQTLDKEGVMPKDRPQHEATAQAKLDGHTAVIGDKHEGFHLGSEDDSRRGAGAAGEGSNRSARDQ